jgi:hypothetical protein
MKTHWTKILLLTWIVSAVLGGFLSTPVFGQQRQYYCKDSCLERNADAYYQQLYKQRMAEKQDSSKIRLRRLVGGNMEDSSTSPQAKTETTQLIWDGWGVSESIFRFKQTSNGLEYDLKQTSSEISYTFGDDWTLTLGAGVVTSGIASIGSTSQGFASEEVTGSTSFAIFGIEFGIFEILFGSHQNEFTYIDFQSNSSTSLGKDYTGSGSQTFVGFGLSF